MRSPKCLEVGCTNQPSYGFRGEKILYCASHKQTDMIDLKNIYCGTCNTLANYGIPGGPPVCCAEHKTEGMINVRSAVCVIDGCMKQPSYGMVNGKKTHCSDHATPEMVDVLHRKCEKCDKNPSFGFEGGQVRFCGKHQEPGMINVYGKLCAVEGCSYHATFNWEGMTRCFCRQHITPGMVNVAGRRCRLCPTVAANNKYDGYCLRCFMYTFPDIKVCRNYKVKERHIHEFLEGVYGSDRFTNDKAIDGGCSKRRPDWFFECFTHTIIVECDENQHDFYDSTCEVARINELYTDLAYRPIVFIRFNPDGYDNEDGERIRSSFKYHGRLDVPVVRCAKEWNKRLKALKEQIDHHKERVPTEAVTVVSMFYDGYASV